MTTLYVLTIHFLVGLVVIDILLRFDRDGRETMDHVRQCNYAAYVFALSFGAILWPWAVYKTIKRALQHRNKLRRRSGGPYLQGMRPLGTAAAMPPSEPVRVVCGRCGEKAVTFFLSPESGSGKRCAQCGHEEAVADLPAAYAQAASQPEIAELSPGEFLCAIPCPSCKGPAKLNKPDERTAGWYRVTCVKGHWGDLRTDSILIPEEHRVPWQEGA